MFTFKSNFDEILKDHPFWGEIDKIKNPFKEYHFDKEDGKYILEIPVPGFDKETCEQIIEKTNPRIYDVGYIKKGQCAAFNKEYDSWEIINKINQVF